MLSPDTLPFLVNPCIPAPPAAGCCLAPPPLHYLEHRPLDEKHSVSEWEAPQPRTAST